MLTRRFWLDALERAVKTFAQSLVAVATAATVADVGASWKTWIGTAALAAAISILTSIGSYAQKDSISPASVVPPT